MTVVVGVAAPDGIVLAADSRTTNFPDGMGDQARYRIITDTADKLFTIRDRFAVATYGDALIGPKTIAGLMDEFIASVEPEPPNDIGKLTEILGGFFHERYEEAYNAAEEPLPEDAPARVGFLVAGYDSDGIGHIHEVFAPGPIVNHEPDLTTAIGGACWRGQTDVINRLVAGVDWSALAAQDEQLSEADIGKLNGLEYDLIYPVTVQDAVDFATFLIRTTIDMQRFSDGISSGGGSVPGCGGETRVVAVQRGDVEWVSQTFLTAHRRVGWAEGSIG
jgi:hypothetical protein